MGRPKGSRNKPASIDEASEGFRMMQEDHAAGKIRSVFEAVPPEPPAFITIALTDEDLAPARRSAAVHARKADEIKARHIQDELQDQKRGDIEDLSVPQVVAYDLSGAFNRIAQQKARDAGYPFYANLRKTPEGWVFDAFKSNPRLHDKAPDQP